MVYNVLESFWKSLPYYYKKFRNQQVVIHFFLIHISAEFYL